MSAPQSAPRSAPHGAPGSGAASALDARAFIIGCAGCRLSDEERAFIAGERPFGLIVFARNLRDPAEIRDLTAAFRDAVGAPDAPVLIDQEGGRVARLRPPLWPAYPAQRRLGEIAELDPRAGIRAAWLHGRLIAADLHDLGITVDCAPVLDVLSLHTSDAIGDRSFGPDARLVAVLGRAVAEGLMAGGVAPVVKHTPGQGRAAADSHEKLPVVQSSVAELAASDFLPFAELHALPIAMTAHVLFSEIDSLHPATLSPTLIRDIIRGRIGFDGLLLSDDVSMGALSGDYSARAEAIYAAGCDIVLHCNGRTEEMRKIGGAAPALGGQTRERAARALRAITEPAPIDTDALRDEYRALLARVAGASA